MRLRIYYICLILVFFTATMKPVIVNSEESTTATTTTLESNLKNSNSGILHAFYPSKGLYSPQMEKYIDDVDSISFAWSRIYSNNPQELNITKGQNGNYDFYYPNDYIQVLKYAKSKEKSIQLSVYMESPDIIFLLPYEEKRNAAIKAIIDHLQKDISNGESLYYDGVVIDFEGLRDTDAKGQEKIYEGKKISHHFVQFLKDIKVQLDNIGKKLYVAANTSVNYNGYDYKAILGIADKMILMAHDYKPSERLRKDRIQQYTGYEVIDPIDSLAPIQKIRRALNDIKSYKVDADEFQKIWLQISFATGQWRYSVASIDEWKRLDGSVLSNQEVEKLSPLYSKLKDRVDNVDGNGSNISYGYNNELQSPYIQYYDVNARLWNVILYEDSNSISAKIELAKSYGLGGISIWSLANIPDYNDLNSKKFHLDGWNTIIQKMSMPFIPENSKEGNVEIKFKDKFVEEAVRRKLYKNSGKITTNDVKSIYRLKLLNGVKYITDLKYLVNLEYLDAEQMGIKDITALASLTKLKVLLLEKNQISNISSLKKLKLLDILHLADNKINDVSPLMGLKNVSRLSLDNNAITNLKGLSGMKMLRILNLARNKISNVQELKNLSNLEVLYLQRNAIRDISPIGTLTNLKELSLNGNLITNIGALGRLKNIQKLYMIENKIINVAPIKGLLTLQELTIEGNDIKDYSPLKSLYALTNFYCDINLE